MRQVIGMIFSGYCLSMIKTVSHGLLLSIYVAHGLTLGFL